MCNLYSLKIKGSELKQAFGPYIDLTNGASFDEKFYPDSLAPVIRNNLDGPELALCRWGMPTPPTYLKAKSDKGVTNVRNIDSEHWQKWLTVDHRCLVPAIAFCEYEENSDPVFGRKTPHWFALDKSQPLFFFAGIWTEWMGVRKAKDGSQDLMLFAFLTTEANSVVAPTHPKAMPAMLTEPEELDMWMTAEWKIAKELQRPLSDSKMVMIE